MTQPGIKPATFPFVAQHLNHCATTVPLSTYTVDEINLKRALGSLGDISKTNYKMKLTGKKQKLRFASEILKILILKWMTTT